MNEKLNSEKSRSKNLLAQQQYGITHDFTTRERLDQQITAETLTHWYELVAIWTNSSLFLVQSRETGLIGSGRQEFMRILRHILDPHLKMQMGAG